MAKLVREEMTGAMTLDVPLKVDVAAGHELAGRGGLEVDGARPCGTCSLSL